MSKQVTFPKGGVHPFDFKSFTSGITIRNAPIPALAVIPMQQHMGKPAQCLVSKDDLVREGMLIGQAQGVFSANIHSPIPGVVKEIRKIYLPTGIRSEAVAIELQGEFDRSGKDEPRLEWQGISGSDLLKNLADKGIVGLGGATFPTVLKYTIREGFQVEYFVVNGVECEPFLTADHRLMVEKALEIIEGIRIVQQIMKPRQIIIGIEENKADAIAVMRENIVRAGLDFEVVALMVKYPQGDEKQLLKAVIGKEVPSGGLPLDIGAVVSNAGTMLAIYEAVVLDKPLIERVVTVSGSIIRNPANLKVRLGTPLSELIEECGGFTEPPAKLIAGGPMMGFAVLDPETPVTKGLSGVIALSRRQVRSPSQTPCIGCGRCVKACPMGLQPTVIYKWIEHSEYEEALKEGLMDCKECGCCGYTCPASIPLIQGMKLGKVMSRKKKKA